MLSNILISLFLTLLIELSISLLLDIKGNDLVKITIINISTNVPLNIIILLLYKVIDYKIVFYLIVPIFEIIIIIIEGTYFKKLKNSILTPYKLSLLLNGFSYGYSFVYLLISKLIK